MGKRHLQWWGDEHVCRCVHVWVYVCAQVHMCGCLCKVQYQVSLPFLLYFISYSCAHTFMPPCFCVSQRTIWQYLFSPYQACRWGIMDPRNQLEYQVPLPTEPSCWPSHFFFEAWSFIDLGTCWLGWTGWSKLQGSAHLHFPIVGGRD